MGLDTYIFKTTKEKADEKTNEILNAKNEIMKKAIKTDKCYYLIYEDENHMNRLNSDIYWRKFNHTTGWFAKNIFGGTDMIEIIHMAIFTNEQLKKLQQDCKKILNRCVKASGEIVIDKKYCQSLFPSLYIPFSGNKDYDEDFISEIKTTLKDVDGLLLTSNYWDTRYIFYADY